MANARTEMNPDIMGGKPVIRGTRVPVELVLRKLGAGMSIEAILADHPRLTHEDVRAVAFYKSNGFDQIPGQSRRLFVPVTTPLRGGGA